MVSLTRAVFPLLRCLCLCSLLAAVSTAGRAQDINFDFEEAELRAVIQAVAEFTGRNFLVDPAVKGTVTVVAPQTLTEEEAYRVFQSVLEVNGYVTVEADGVTKIVPQDKGKLGGAFPSGREAGGDDIVTRVIRLEHVRAERLVPLLRPLIPGYGHLAGDAESGSLILTDRAANVARLVNIIERLDRPASAGEVELVNLTHASAEEMAQLFSRLHRNNGGPDAPGDGLVVIADPRTNSLVIKADTDTRKEIKDLALALDTPSSGRGNTHVIYLKNASAESLVEVLESSLTNAPDAEGGSLSKGISIKADPETNALVVTATQSEFAILEQVIRKLDVRRLQVYVEALIAEVDARTTQEIGVQFGIGDGVRADRRGVVGATNLGTNAGTSLAQVLANPLAAGAGLSFGYVDGIITLPDGTEVYNLNALAKALEGQSDANVLSTPNILTMDNEEAEIVVGQNVPFITGSFSQISQGTAVENPFQTIQRRDVGLTLRIKPQITEGSAIKMEIFQEVSNVALRGEARDIVTNTRSLSTTIVAENNQMVVLGGLIQDDVSNNVQKVPLLGDVPILGQLFRYKNRTRKKTNLLVFLRPQVIRGPKDMDEPTRDKYEYLGRLTDQEALKDNEEAQSMLEEWELITGDTVVDDAGPAEQQPGAHAEQTRAGQSQTEAPADEQEI